MEKALTRTFSWLKVPSSNSTFKTLSRHYTKKALIYGWYVYRRKIGMLVGSFNQEMALVGRSLLCDYKRALCGPSFEALAAERQ